MPDQDAHPEDAKPAEAKPDGATPAEAKADDGAPAGAGPAGAAAGAPPGVEWFWVVDCDNTVPRPYIADQADLSPFEEHDFEVAKAVENWNPQAWFKVTDPEDDGDPDDVLQIHLDVQVYSPRLRAALEAAGIRGIQYLPVRVVRSDGTEVPGFSIANLLNLVEALDISRSKVLWNPSHYGLKERRGTIRAIRWATLRASALQGFDVIRLKEYWPSIYVSERFVAAFEAGRFTGYSFHRVPLV